ncbi:Enzyme that catalyzes the fourth step in the histidine pathway [Phlyctochytrium bullatum]|nr:Enzyme that catalyzes the fourth step in the histidine pathway [Phlyctochytrium bullatum]
MTRFRPCIDLHHGQVKQIVGASLTDDAPSNLKTNFVASHPPSYYANLYKENDLHGAHVIKLGDGNDDAAKEALAAWPKGLQIGGGINIDNAQAWLDAGASKIIVTSWLFPSSKFSEERLRKLCESVGKENLVVDVSEFLVHAADVEGLCKGIDENLVKFLGEWCTIPVTYAGGGSRTSICFVDLGLVEKLSNGKVDLTFGRFELIEYLAHIDAPADDTAFGVPKIENTESELKAIATCAAAPQKNIISPAFKIPVADAFTNVGDFEVQKNESQQEATPAAYQNVRSISQKKKDSKADDKKGSPHKVHQPEATNPHTKGETVRTRQRRSLFHNAIAGLSKNAARVRVVTPAATVDAKTMKADEPPESLPPMLHEIGDMGGDLATVM